MLFSHSREMKGGFTGVPFTGSPPWGWVSKTTNIWKKTLIESLGRNQVQTDAGLSLDLFTVLDLKACFVDHLKEKY